MTASPPRPVSPADTLQIEQSLRAAVPEAVFASPRAVRRIIRSDLDLPLLRARVPHRDSIALPPARLLELADDVWTLPPALPDTILLVARPDAEAFAFAGRTALLREYWRLLYHGCLDIAARRLLQPVACDDDSFHRLTAAVGDAAVAEAAAVLAQEGLLRNPGDPREVMAEFIATTLELAEFEPGLLPAWFPAVRDHARMVPFLGSLVAADAVLARTRPAGLADPGGGSAVRSVALSDGDRGGLPRAARPGSGSTTRLHRGTLAAVRRGNDVRGALLRWRMRALAGGDAVGRGRAERGILRRLTRLVRRLDRAVGLGGTSRGDAVDLLETVLDHAGGSAWSQPARFLYDLQKICVDSERESYRTRLLSWACTLGRVPLTRPLPAQRVALVHRHAAAAFARLPSLDVPRPTRDSVATLVAAALRGSEAAVRTRLAPPVRRSLDAAGLRPATLVEQAAFDKLVDDLLDSVVERGFESFGSVRDAISRSQVKLPDLAGVRELVGGDPLLRADRNLTAALDGAYRQAPIYLLAMQRLSAVAFGVPLGRALTLHLLLPFGGAWILWRGLEHVVEPVTGYFLEHPVHVYSRWAVGGTGAVAWALMHLPAVRGAALRGVRSAGGLARLVFVTLPRRLLRLPVVERLLRSRPVRIFRRYAWSPLVVTVVAWSLLPRGGGWLARGNPWMPAGLFVCSAVVLNSPAGRAVQEQVLEGIGRAAQQIHARLIVGLLAWIVDTFRRAVDFVEGMLYAVDEQLRFRTGESRATLALKALLTTLWSGVDWFVRFCVTLLIEPQLNPIKHFPVVTVSHKVLMPMVPAVASHLAAATGMGIKVASTAVFFGFTAIPGVFGFLAWELKENWRLYAANRPRVLTPLAVGRHGESMRRLLLPGFHSGTIPKLFGRLRRQFRGRGRRRRRRTEEQLAELGHDITAFVDDECLGLLRRSRPLAGIEIRVADVRLATNLVAVDLGAEAIGPEPLTIELRQRDGLLESRLAAEGWLARLTGERRRLVRLALDGLERLCGVDLAEAGVDGGGRPPAPIAWTDWQDAWERERGGGAAPPDEAGPRKGEA